MNDERSETMRNLQRKGKCFDTFPGGDHGSFMRQAQQAQRDWAVDVYKGLTALSDFPPFPGRSGPWVAYPRKMTNGKVFQLFLGDKTVATSPMALVDSNLLRPILGDFFCRWENLCCEIRGSPGMVRRVFLLRREPEDWTNPGKTRSWKFPKAMASARMGQVYHHQVRYLGPKTWG